jgi:hypothetical protein
MCRTAERVLRVTASGHLHVYASRLVAAAGSKRASSDMFLPTLSRGTMEGHTNKTAKRTTHRSDLTLPVFFYHPVLSTFSLAAIATYSFLRGRFLAVNGHVVCVAGYSALLNPHEIGLDRKQICKKATQAS